MTDSADPACMLREFRDSIDNIDAAIVHMLAERFRCTRAVGKLKAQHGLSSRDPGREAEQVSRLRHLATASNLDPDFAEKFLSFVIHEVLRQHETARSKHQGRSQKETRSTGLIPDEAESERDSRTG